MNYASWFQRVGGYLIDSFIISIPMACGYVILFATMQDNAPTAPGLGALSILMIASLCVNVYNRYFLGGRQGQTWGRKILDIHLIDERTGRPIGAGNAFVRDLAHILDSLACYVGWFMPLFDVKGQTFADKIMNTVVVRSH